MISGERELYDGYAIAGIDCTPGFECIEFSNTETVMLGKSIGSIDENIIKEAQIKKTIRIHLDKELRYRDHGIKVLSLFFIDEVKKYRTPEGGKGLYAEMFERCYNELINLPKYQPLKSQFPHDVTAIHDGYFSQDKKGALKDTKGDTAADRALGQGIELNAKLYGHIKKLFSFVNLSNEEKNTLMNVSLFGIEGINIELYSGLVKSNDIGTIKKLNKKGWVKYNDRTSVISVHPTIRMLVFNELNPMNTMLYKDIIHSIKQDRVASIEEIHKYIISAIKIANNEFVPNEIRADMYESIAHKINMIGGASSCNSYIFYPGDYFAEAYNIKKNIYDKENRECIIARLNLLSSTTIFRWTKYNKTFEEKFQEIKQICEIADKYYKRDFELLAKIYDSLSYIYRSRTIGAAPDNDRKIALRSNKLALSYKKKLLIKELVFRPKVLISRKRFKDDRLLKIYLSVAYSYLCMGRAVHDKKLSLKYFKRALDISKKVLPQNHFILAQLHYEVARELFELNINSNEWCFYIEKSLEIFESFPAEGLSLILRICNRETAIKCYEKVHDYNKAIVHMHKFINDKKAKECMNISSDVPDWRIEWFVIDEFEKLVNLCDKNADYHSALKYKKHIAGLFEKDIAELMNSYNQEITNSESKEILYDSVVLRCERAIKLYENIIDYAMLHLKPESYKEEQIFNNKRNMLIEKLNEVKERNANVVKK